MDKELEAALFDKYPSLFRDRDKSLMRWGMTCGNGWYTLIDQLCTQLVKQSTDIQAKQVKEKFGELRFYLQHTNKDNQEYVFGLTTMASLLSITICDQCGLKGNRHNDLYVCTRCKKHRPKNQQKEQKKQWPTPDLPFPTDDIGAMWLSMIDMFYSHVVANRHLYTDLAFIEAKKVNGKLKLVLEKGNQQTDGMLTMLLAYASRVDEETGKPNNQGCSNYTA